MTLTEKQRAEVAQKALRATEKLNIVHDVVREHCGVFSEKAISAAAHEVLEDLRTARIVEVLERILVTMEIK